MGPIPGAESGTASPRVGGFHTDARSGLALNPGSVARHVPQLMQAAEAGGLVGRAPRKGA